MIGFGLILFLMTFNLRGDGVRQTYFQDPDNYWIEVCEANPDGTVG